MANKDKFLDLVDRLPVDNEKVMGHAMSFFISRQKPEDVKFKRYKNGYQIHVYTDTENATQAKEFWEKNVQPYLGGDS